MDAADKTPKLLWRVSKLNGFLGRWPVAGGRGAPAAAGRRQRLLVEFYCLNSTGMVAENTGAIAEKILCVTSNINFCGWWASGRPA